MAKTIRNALKPKYMTKRRRHPVKQTTQKNVKKHLEHTVREIEKEKLHRFIDNAIEKLETNRDTIAQHNPEEEESIEQLTETISDLEDILIRMIKDKKFFYEKYHSQVLSILKELELDNNSSSSSSSKSRSRSRSNANMANNHVKSKSSGKSHSSSKSHSSNNALTKALAKLTV